MDKEDEPSPIQTSDADRISGPETVESLISGPESLISGPQTFNSSVSSVNTRASAKSAASAVETEASSTESECSGGKPSAASSPAGSIHGFPLDESPTPVKAADDGGAAAGGSAATPVIAPLQEDVRQQQEKQQKQGKRVEVEDKQIGEKKKKMESNGEGTATGEKETEEFKGEGKGIGEKEEKTELKGEGKGIGEKEKGEGKPTGEKEKAKESKRGGEGIGDMEKESKGEDKGTGEEKETELKGEDRGTKDKEAIGEDERKGDNVGPASDQASTPGESLDLDRALCSPRTSTRLAVDAVPSTPAENVDLDRALCSPRTGVKPAAEAAPGEPTGNVRGVRAPDRGPAVNPNSEEAADSEQDQPWGGGQEEWGGVSEGMFRKRISDDLKAMLKKIGGTCKMVKVAATHRTVHGRLLNLQGKKLRLLLTSGSGLYGIDLYGTGQDAEIRLKGRTATDRPSVSATNPDVAFDPSRMKQLTRTFVNPDARRSDTRRSHESNDFGRGERGNSNDRQHHTAVESPPMPLGSRNTKRYSRSFADAADSSPRRRDHSPPNGHMVRDRRYPKEASRQRGGDARQSWRQSRRRSRSRSRSRSGHRRGRTASGSNWDQGAGGGGGRNGFRSSSADNGRFSHTGSRGVRPHRRQSPQRRLARSPSPHNRDARRRSPSTKLSGSRTSRRRSSSPRRDVSPMGRGYSSRYSAERRSVGRARSRSRDDRGISPETRRTNGTVPPSARRDAPPSSRQAAWNPSTGKAKDDGSMVDSRSDTRQESYHRRREDGDGVPPRGYGSGSPPTSYDAPIGYNTEGSYGAPRGGRRGSENGHHAGGVGAAGAWMMDPTIPLAPGGAPTRSSAAAGSGKRVLAESAGRGVGGFSLSDEPPSKRYHAPPSNSSGYPMGQQNVMTGGSWQGTDGGGNNRGGIRGPPPTSYPAPATLPPLSSLRPFRLPAGPVQGARLMIRGTHPAVPERRIHGIVSNFGVVGKIEVLEGFVFVHMKSVEEASRAVNGLNGSSVPHVSPPVNHNSGAPPPRLTAAIWREDLYVALMSRENMRVYADSMRRASTWYEKQTKSRLSEMQAKLMPCRFYALGRGCMFGNNCEFRHDDRLPQHASGVVNPQAGAAGPSFGDPPAPKPVAHPLPPSLAFESGPDTRAGVGQLPYRRGQGRVPVLDHGQSPTLSFVPRSEAQLNRGLGAQGVRGRPFGNDVGVATPWQPEDASGAGEASVSEQASPPLGTRNGRSVGHHQQPARGGGPSQVAESSEKQRNGGGRTYGKGGDKPRRSGYRSSSEGSADGRSDRGGGGGSRRDGSCDGNRGDSSRGLPYGSNESRGRGDKRRTPSSSMSRPGSSLRRSSLGRSSPRRSSHRRTDSRRSSPRRSSPRRSRPRRSSLHRSSPRHSSTRRSSPRRRSPRRSSPRRSNPRSSSPRRGSGGFQRRGAGRFPGREAGRQRERRDSRSRRSESRESATDRSSRKHRRDGDVQQQPRDSRSDSPRHTPRGGAAMQERSATRREWAPRNGRYRDSVSPAGQGRHREASYSPRARERRHDGDGGDVDLDGRRWKKSRNERDDSRGRGVDHGRHNGSDEGRGSFVGWGGGRREGGNGGHGWISSNNPRAFSREVERRSSVDPIDGNAAHLNERYPVDDSMGRNGSAEWNDHDDLMGQEWMRLESPPQPVETKFTVTTNKDSLLVPPPAAAAPIQHGRRKLKTKPETKFSVRIDDAARALGQPTSPPVGRRGGKPARGRGRGRGRGGRVGNERGGHPPRGFQHGDGEWFQEA